MCGYTRLNRIRNVVIREKAGVALIEDKIKETRLRQFGHVMRRCINAPVRMCEMINLMHYRRGIGCSKINWSEVIRHDLKCMGLMEDMAQDRSM